MVAPFFYNPRHFLAHDLICGLKKHLETPSEFYPKLIT